MCVILLPTFNPYGIVLITVGLKLLINIGKNLLEKNYSIHNTQYTLLFKSFRILNILPALIS